MKPALDERRRRRVEGRFPKSPTRPKGGRPRADDGRCLEGVLCFQRTGCPWECLPREPGLSGTACWRRHGDWHGDWHGAGVWAKLRLRLLDALGREGAIDESRASVDSARLGAKEGRGHGPQPVDRGKPGTKRHVLVDARALPPSGRIFAGGDG